MLVCLNWNSKTHTALIFVSWGVTSNLADSWWFAHSLNQKLTHPTGPQAPARHTAGRDSNSSGQSIREAALTSARLGRGRSEPSDSNKQLQMGRASLGYIQHWLHAPPCPPAWQFIPPQRVKHVHRHRNESDALCVCPCYLCAQSRLSQPSSKVLKFHLFHENFAQIYEDPDMRTTFKHLTRENYILTIRHGIALHNFRYTDTKIFS